MKVSYENIYADKNSSFRTLHVNDPVNDLRWEYHYHQEIELICVVSGTGTRHIGYHKSTFREGDLVLIGSNVPHSGFGLNSSDPHEEIVLQFKEEIITLPQEIEEINPLRKLISDAKLGILFDVKVKNKILPKLVEILNSKPEKRYLLLLSILIELSEIENYVLLNEEVMPFTIISKHKVRIQTIFSYVEQNYHKQIDISVVANQVNLTLPAFCNFFKKATKLTFTEFVNHYRIDKACALISQGNSISESCYNSGYNNVPYFNRIFKKYMGKTPTEFNKELTQ